MKQTNLSNFSYRILNPTMIFPEMFCFGMYLSFNSIDSLLSQPSQDEIQNLWKNFNSNLSNLKTRIIKKDWEKYGIIFYDFATKKIYYLACVEVTQFNSTWNQNWQKNTGLSILKEKFFKFEHHGPL